MSERPFPLARDAAMGMAIAVVLPLLGGSALAAVPAESARAVERANTTTVTHQAFRVELRSVGEYSVGRRAVAEVVLIARDPYKVNDKYPFKFTFASPVSTKNGPKVVSRDAVTFASTRAVMRLDFVPEAAGPLVLSGVFKFSVCTDDQCLVERERLALRVTVK